MKQVIAFIAIIILLSFGSPKKVHEIEVNFFYKGKRQLMFNGADSFKYALPGWLKADSIEIKIINP